MKEIPLTKGKVALVDDEDYELLSQYNWFAHRAPNADYFYARRNSLGGGKRKTINMARFIMNAPDYLQVDHINHDTLNNCKNNLRLVTHQQNGCNQKPQIGKAIPYKGVSKNGDKYQARIKLNGENIYLGRFDTAEKASEAYLLAANKIFGEYAYPQTNIPLPPVEETK